jgi:apolipoprotein N-acyltransferase
VIRYNHRISKALAVALATGAVAPAGASAMLPPPDPPQPAHSTTVELVRVSGHSGFDWGDAGIGAAGALGLSMLAAGGIVVVTRRRTHGPTGATS